MHPTTLGPGIPPRRFGTILAYQPARTQAAFLYSLADDLERQRQADIGRGYRKLAEDMGGAIEQLLTGAHELGGRTIDQQAKDELRPYAEDAGALRYDAMITLLESYAEISKQRSVNAAAAYVREAWGHTPLEWKRHHAPETLRNH